MKKEFSQSNSLQASEKNYNLSKKENWSKPTISELDYRVTNEEGGIGSDFGAEANS